MMVTMAITNPPIRWKQIDTLLLDMDGTLLDLAFDNFFWLELVPTYYGKLRGLSDEVALAEIEARYAQVRGSLKWYCVDHWTQELGLNISELKHEMRHMIGYLPGVVQFLRVARLSKRRLVIVTNAHPETLAVKLRQTHLDRFVDDIVSSHETGHAKEAPEFWPLLERKLAFKPGNTVFFDDSEPVIEAALAYGLPHAVKIRRPDTQQPSRDSTTELAVDSLAELTPDIR
jgi:putative hydrolase of the HAD superfamily